MIEIDLFTNKNYVDLKTAFGMYKIKRLDKVIDSKVICLNGPCTVQIVVIICALAAIRSMKNLHEPVIFRCNNELFKKLLNAKSDGTWTEKINNSNASMYVFLLRQEIENRSIKFGISSIPSDLIDGYKEIVNAGRSKLKKYGLENTSNNSSE